MGPIIADCEVFPLTSWQIAKYNGDMTKKQKDIADSFGISESTVSLIVSGRRYTKNAKLAMQIARKTGKAGIEYINPKLRTVYQKAYPRLKG